MDESHLSRQSSKSTVSSWKDKIFAGLFGLLCVGIVAFFVLGFTYGPAQLRDQLAKTCVLVAIALLVRLGIVKEAVVTWTVLFLVCVAGPLFCAAMVGNYFGWW